MLIFLNNKANLDLEEFKEYQKELKSIKTEHQIVLIPTTAYLSIAGDESYSLGSQEVSRFADGAHTGRTSAAQLKSLNVKYTLVGHSEVRDELSETNEKINDKIKVLLQNDITPVLCVGELAEEREVRDLVIIRQLKLALLNIEDADKIIIAYEPRWAVNSGMMPTKDRIGEVLTLIRNNFPNNKVIYGGSININTVDEVKEVGFDGLIIGNASCNINEVKDILNVLK